MISGVKSTKFTIVNNCPYTIWPATLTGGGGSSQASTGFELAHGASTSFDIPAQWTGRFWARTECSTQTGKFLCATADCGSSQVACNGAGAIPPATLVEFTLGGFQGKDFYDVSLVDGFNLPVSVVPDNPNCHRTDCPVDMNAKCPTELALRDGNGAVSMKVIGDLVFTFQRLETAATISTSWRQRKGNRCRSARKEREELEKEKKKNRRSVREGREELEKEKKKDELIWRKNRGEKKNKGKRRRKREEEGEKEKKKRRGRRERGADEDERMKKWRRGRRGEKDKV
ncbi:hypothetical protein DM860_011770 [Cuscuta australis]|uniref:Thaumatin-like protein n=1 Tax=Cuscuta australis TaxID=267555 RepID=A0A328DK96_9ASTE|nr:hypothetical protein DM860_011770 [Cuscuta australis]